MRYPAVNRLELLAAVAKDRRPVGEQQMVEVDLGDAPHEAVA
jgi:hypothetical protein